MKRAHNFSAGPAILPIEVLEAASKAALDYNGLGMSIMEMSHRSKEYDEVFKQTQRDGLQILGLNEDEYTVLFLGGGASLQFHMVPMNFLINKADYVNTGVWAKKAIKEAKWVGNVNVVASSEDKVYNYIPKDIKFNDDADYIHITTNNTIYGTRWNKMPEVKAPLFSDMSSDFMSRPLDYGKFDLIYAGAQKNIGPAGVTMVILKKSLLEKQRQNIPTMLDYKIHFENESMFNTPPAFNVYVVGQVFKWIIKQGGLTAIEEYNNKKAGILYDFVDSHSDFYVGTVAAKEDRSIMNVCWNITNRDLEGKFVEEAKKRYNMTNLKGHRSIGGIRASIYNAMPIESVEALVKFMEEFYKENKHLIGAEAAAAK